MKKLLICSLITALAVGALNAQPLGQGNFMLGSTLGFSTAKSDVTSASGDKQQLTAHQLSVAPSVGYFLLPKLALGVGAEYTRSRVDQPDRQKTEDSDLLFGPFVRAYFPTSESVAFFAVANFGFGNSTDLQTIGATEQRVRNNIIAVGAGPGITVFSPGGFALEAIVKYNYARSKFNTSIGGVSASHSTHTNQVALSLGLQYYFGGLRAVGR